MRDSLNAYVACVPHVPFLAMMEKEHNRELWNSYEARIEEYEAFDPDVTIVFGGDHYTHVHLNMAPTFMVGHVAEAGDDCGGTPGTLDVPMALSRALVDALVEDGFDITTSYAMKVDHGFSNVLGAFFNGKLDARPVIPIHINAMTDPRPTMKRVRELGAAVGRWAKASGKRTAFIGSGGLSHQTDFIFPQYDTAPDENVRAFLVHGGKNGGEVTDQKWHDDIQAGMDSMVPGLISGEFQAPWINKEWDEDFLRIMASGDLQQIDAWKDADMIAAAGYGGSEVRSWLAAIAAGEAAGAPQVRIDYYSEKSTLAVGAGVMHSELEAA